MDDSLYIGIDLGTTNSCVSCYINGEVKVLENSEGDYVTPSVIYFDGDNDNPLVGKTAKRKATLKPEFEVCEVKRLIGRQYDDPNLQRILKNFQFQIINASNKPVVEIETKTGTIRKTPEELSAYILRKIKKDAEVKLGQIIDKAVITIPAYFNVNQREATLNAAAEAGFTVLKLLSEPAAAALCYYYEFENQRRDCQDKKYSLVCDLGGGTFDVAILKKNKNQIDIVCVDGDSFLGGHDFDNLIMDHINSKLSDCNMKCMQSCKPSHLRRMKRRLINACEEVKKDLSNATETQFIIDYMFKTDEPDLDITLSRQEFEEIGDDLFAKIITIIDKCLKESKLSKFDIKEVILAGGSTRIPKIEFLISQYFDYKKLNKMINPDVCVAKGAAIQAALFSQNPQQKIENIQITEVIPLPIGIRSSGGAMSVIIKKNSPIPTSNSKSYTNTAYGRTKRFYCVYEGERADVTKNNFLGKLILENVTSAPPGQCEVIVTLSVDQNGILTITAREKLKDNSKILKVVYSRNPNNTSRETDNHSDEIDDQDFLRFVSKKKYLLKYCRGIIYNIDNLKLTETHKDIYEICKTMNSLVSTFNIEDEDEIDKLSEKILEKCNPLELEYQLEHMPLPLKRLEPR